MADRKLTQITEVTSHDPDDLMYVVRNSTSYKMKTGIGHPIRFDSRSDIVTYLSGATPPTNTILKDSQTGLEWLYDGSSSVISDMDNCVPVGKVTFRHFGATGIEYGTGTYPNTPTVDDTTVIQSAIDYCIENGLDLDGEGLTYGITDTVTWGESTTSINISGKPEFSNASFVVIDGTNFTSGSQSGDDPTAWTFGNAAFVVGKNHSDSRKVKLGINRVTVDCADLAGVAIYLRGVTQSEVTGLEAFRGTEVQVLAGVHNSDKDSCTATHLSYTKAREASFGDEKYGESGTDGTITSGSTTFSSSSASFVAGDVGKSIAIVGAGNSGAILETTISSVTDSQTIELTDSASTTISGEYYVYLEERTSSGFLNYSSDIRISKCTFNNCKYSGVMASGFNFTAEQCVWWNGFKRLWEDSRSLWVYSGGGTRQFINNRIDDGQCYIEDFPGLVFTNNIFIQYGNPSDTNNPSANKPHVAWVASVADEDARGLVFKNNIVSSTFLPIISLETKGSGTWATIQASYGGNIDYGFNDATVQGLTYTLSDDLAVMDKRLAIGHGKATGGNDVARIRYDGDDFFITPTDAAGDFDFQQQIRYDQSQRNWSIPAIRSFSSPRVDLTITSGTIDVTNTYHTIATESGASTDDLDTINGGRDGMIVILRPRVDGETVFVKHDVGNILCQGSDINLTSTASNVTLIYDDTAGFWFVTSVRVPTNKLLLEN